MQEKNKKLQKLKKVDIIKKKWHNAEEFSKGHFHYLGR